MNPIRQTGGWWGDLRFSRDPAFEPRSRWMHRGSMQNADIAPGSAWSSPRSHSGIRVRKADRLATAGHGRSAFWSLLPHPLVRSRVASTEAVPMYDSPTEKKRLREALTAGERWRPGDARAASSLPRAHWLLDSISWTLPCSGRQLGGRTSRARCEPEVTRSASRLDVHARFHACIHFNQPTPHP